MNSNIILTCAFLLICTVTGAIEAWGVNSEGAFVSSEKQLISDLMKYYDPAVRPVKSAKDTVMVNLSLSLANIYDVDEKNKMLKMKGWLHQTWTDALLTWNPSDYEDIKSIRLPANRVWKPDVMLYNYQESRFGSTSNDGLVSVDSNGTVSWVPLNTMIKSSCSFKMKYFPFDDQTCHLMFGSWIYPTRQVNLSISEKHSNRVHYQGDEWQMRKSEFKTRIFGEFESDGDKDTFTVAILTVSMKRHGAYYRYMFVTPSILLAIVTLLIFLVPPQAGERFTLGSTVIIGVTLLLVMLENHLPVEVSDVPHIASYLIFVFVMDVMAIIMSVIVMNFHHRDIRRGQVPNWMREYVLNRLSSLVCMKADSYQSVPTNTNEGNGLHLDVDVTMDDVERANIAKQQQSAAFPTTTQMSMDKTLADIRDYLKGLNEKADVSEKAPTHRQIVINEWHHVALVVDRILFIIFALITVMTSIIML